MAAENPASRTVLSPQVTVGKTRRRPVAVSPENQPYPLSRPQQPEAGARVGAGPLGLKEALRLTFQLAVQVAVRITAQTTVQTGPQVKPRDILQQPLQVPSAEVLPVALQFIVRVPVESGSPIATRDPVDFAVGFAPQVASRTTVRTTPGTVPGTVPRATREASFPVTCGQTTLPTCGETASYEEDPE